MVSAIGPPVLQPGVTDRQLSSPRARDRILKVLETESTHLEPKIIAYMTGIKHNTVKGELRRLARSNIVERDEAGYFLPRREFERYLEREVKYNGQKDSLPRVHDIHLTFKVENLRKLSSQVEMIDAFRALNRYAVGDRGPAPSTNGNALIGGCTDRACLSPAEVADLLFNPDEGASLYQMWDGSLSEREKVKKIKGGFQETFYYEAWKLIVQFYRTGTIKVIFSNSAHPFDAVGLQNAIHDVDGVFLARTGMHFIDVASFFYIEKIHIGSDVLKDREFSGASRFNCTIKQLDRWLFRTYEKVLGGQLYVRNEACLEGGSFEGSPFNALLAMVERNTAPTYTDLMIYRQGKRLEAVEGVTRRLGIDHVKLKMRVSPLLSSDMASSASPHGNPFRTQTIRGNEQKEVSER